MVSFVLNQRLALIVLILFFSSDCKEVRKAKRVKIKRDRWYTPLHPKLFGESPRVGWFDDHFIEAHKLSGGRFEALVRKEDPDGHVYSFPFLKPRYAKLLVEEASHYNASGLSMLKPTAMNSYGILLGEAGMQKMFDRIAHKFLRPLTRMLFAPVGGDSVDVHRVFVEQVGELNYSAVPLHRDDCDVAINVALEDHSNYIGSDVEFCGLFGSDAHRQHTVTYRAELGRAVMFDCRVRHAVQPVSQGSRSSLVILSQSSQYRQSATYASNMEDRLGEKDRPAPQCISPHEDEDYCRHKLPGHEAFCSPDGLNVFKVAWENVLKNDDFWEFGVVFDAQSRITKNMSAKNASEKDEL